MSKRSKQVVKIVLPVWAVLLLIVGVLLYQFFIADAPADPQPVTPTIAAQNPPTVAAPPSPTTIAQRPPTGTVPPATITPRSSTATPASGSSKFDFYLLALSWSPDYCATNDNPDPQQCSIGKKLGFVLHGLWPQYNQGYPSNCSNVKLPASVKQNFPGLYPSQSLFDHEWEKHGTCSGLTSEKYLALSKQLKDSVAIPASYRAPEQPLRVTIAQMKKEFIVANPAYTEQTLAVECSGAGRFLQELYVCFTIEGKPTACSREVQNDAARSCQQADFLIRNVK